MSRSVQYLSRFCAEQRLEKKWLIVPSYQIGHQIGEALAKEGGSWVNLHFATLPSLAQETAAQGYSLRVYGAGHSHALECPEKQSCHQGQ